MLELFGIKQKVGRRKIQHKSYIHRDSNIKARLTRNEHVEQRKSFETVGIFSTKLTSNVCNNTVLYISM